MRDLQKNTLEASGGDLTDIKVNKKKQGENIVRYILSNKGKKNFE